MCEVPLVKTMTHCHHYLPTSSSLHFKCSMSTLKNKSARQKRIAEQRKQKDEFNTEPNCIRNTTLDLIIGMDI